MAHTFDTKAQWLNQTGNPANLSLTLGSTATVLVVSIQTELLGGSPRAGGAPTYNGTSLTQADSTSSTGEFDNELWYLIGPDTGSSYTLSIPNTGGEEIHVEASSYISATGASAYDTANGTTNDSTFISQGVTPSDDGAVIVSACATDSKEAMTGNQTDLYQTDLGSRA